MKILQITSHYNQGGAARIAACIHEQLRAEGVEAKLAYGRGNVVSEEDVIKFNKEYEIYISAFLSRFTGVNGWWNRKGTERLLRMIRDFQPDVIHLHALHGYYVNYKKLWEYFEKNKIPVIWTFHDCHAFTGNCGYFFACSRWQSGCGKCPYLRNYPASQWFDFTAWMWKRKKELFTVSDNMIIVTPSDWLTNVVKKSFFSKYSCVTIRNGIDTENTFYPREKTAMRLKHGYRPEDKLVLGIAAGYQDPRKGVKYIIEMAKSLEGEARIILIGWDNQRNSSVAEVKNVIPMQTISDTNLLAEYYSMADVFVIPSLAENYATTVLEAMACGTPVVGFRTGGIPEQLAGGRGIAVESGDQVAFTVAVREVLQGSDKVKRGEMLAAEIRKENSLAKMSEHYRDLYKEVLEKANR